MSFSRSAAAIDLADKMLEVLGKEGSIGIEMVEGQVEVALTMGSGEKFRRATRSAPKLLDAFDLALGDCK